MDILEIFDTANMRDYYRERPIEPMLGEIFFPNSEKINELEVEYIVGADNQPVLANIHAMDSETEVMVRDTVKIKNLELLKIALKKQLKEKDLHRLNRALDSPEKAYVANILYNDVRTNTESVRTAIEVMRFQAMANGILVFNGNGIKDGTVDYQVPAENKYTPSRLPGGLPWSDPDAPILDDIFTMRDELVQRDGDEVTRAVTSPEIMAMIIRNKSVRMAMFGVNSDMIMTEAQLNAFLMAQGLPQIVTDNRTYRIDKRTPKHATRYKRERYFPKDKFVMLPEVQLGETMYSITVEEIRRSPLATYSEVDNILTMVYESNLDPVGVWTKSCAIAIPTFPEAGNVIQAKVLE